MFYCGSFSKTLAPAPRVGYVLAVSPVLIRILSPHLARGGSRPDAVDTPSCASAHFDAHVNALNKTLKAKCGAIVSALREHFGAAAEFRVPRGGIFIWVTLPDAVDTSRLAEVALAEGVAINPGAEWSADPQRGRHSLRLCFGNPSIETIREGVARLAKICHRETGIPELNAAVAQPPLPLPPG